jgi:hypothetical protein
MSKTKPTRTVRKPSTGTSLEKAEEFVESGPGTQELRSSAAQQPEHSPPQQPEHPVSQTSAIVTRKDGRTRRRITVYLSVDLAKKLKVQAATEDLEMSQVVESALAAYLAD